MEELDERIAMLKRAQRMEEKAQENGSGEEETFPVLTMEEIREGIRSGCLCFPKQEELHFKTIYLFQEQIPIILPDDFYAQKQETEDLMLYADHEKNVTQSLLHLPEDMMDLSLGEWEKQIKDGMKEQKMYIEIVKRKSLQFLDYLSYRTPTKEGWVYNLYFRVHRQNRRIIGAYNCLEKDMDTYGQLIEALVLEIDPLL